MATSSRMTFEEYLERGVNHHDEATDTYIVEGDIKLRAASRPPLPEPSAMWRGTDSAARRS